MTTDEYKQMATRVAQAKAMANKIESIDQLLEEIQAPLPRGKQSQSWAGKPYNERCSEIIRHLTTYEMRDGTPLATDAEIMPFVVECLTFLKAKAEADLAVL